MDITLIILRTDDRLSLKNKDKCGHSWWFLTLMIWCVSDLRASHNSLFLCLGG